MLRYAPIPRIDIAPVAFDEDHDQGDRDAVVEQVLAAASRVGFMEIVGHGVPPKLINEAVGVAREFFEEDFEVKVQSMGTSVTSVGYSPFRGGKNSEETYSRRGGSGNLKEEFDLGPPSGTSPVWKNVYPSKPERFQRVIDAYYREMERLQNVLSGALTRALTIATGVPIDGDHVAKQMGRHRGLLRLLHYPRCNFVPVPGALRQDPHTDWTPFTILWIEKEDLEVMEEDEWSLVPARSDSFIVNIGDQLHWASNGRFRSVLHRVNGTRCRESSRISFAFFCTEAVDPTDDTVLTPLCAPGEVARFSPVCIRDYLLERFDAVNQEKKALARISQPS